MDGDFGSALRALNFNVPALVSKLKATFAHPFATGKLVTVSLASGATSATAFHGLERAYRGGVVVSSTVAIVLTVDPPTASNAAQQVTVRTDAAAPSAVTIQVLVF